MHAILPSDMSLFPTYDALKVLPSFIVPRAFAQLKVGFIVPGVFALLCLPPPPLQICRTSTPSLSTWPHGQPSSRKSRSHNRSTLDAATREKGKFYQSIM